MHKKAYIAIVIYFIFISFSLGQNSNVLDIQAMCHCYNEKDKNLVFQHILSFKDKYVEVLTFSKCTTEDEYLLSWSEQEVDTICDIIKSIKGISLLKIGIGTESTLLQKFQFLRILEHLPPAQNAEVYLGGQFRKDDTTTLWNSLKQTPIIFDVRQKVTIKNYFDIEEELEWDGKTCLSFPHLDTLIVENFASPYLHPSFGYRMDSLKVLLFINNKSKDLNSAITSNFVGFPASIGQLTNLKTFHFEGQIRLLKIEMPSSFGNLEKLEKLVVLNTSINFPNSVIGLQNLEKLVLLNFWSNIEKVGIDVNSSFFKLKNLDSVVVDCCLTAPVLEKLKKLEYLNLNKCPTNLRHLTNLKQLNILCNWQDSFFLPKGINMLSQLKEINLSGVKKLPPNFGLLKKLKKLNISNYLCETLPKSFGKLSSLENLSINLSLLRKDLKELPSNFGQLKKLKTLTLMHCSFSKLPKSFGNFPMLEHLMISTGNDNEPRTLKELPSNFFNLPNIKTIKLDVGEIKKWPDFKISLDSLSSLRINSLSEYLPKGWNKLQQLQFLSIESNASYFPNEILAIKNLNYLNLNMPFLTKLPDSLDDLSNLSIFNLLSDTIENLSIKWKFPKLKEAIFFTKKINTFPLFLFNSLEFERLVIGHTITDLEQGCLLHSKLNSSNKNGYAFFGNYTLSDLPDCFKGKYNTYLVGVGFNWSNDYGPFFPINNRHLLKSSKYISKN